MTSRIGSSAVLQGRLESKDSLVINGQIKGSVNSSNSLTVGKTGKVRADLKARKVVILGRLKGNIEAREKLEIGANGMVVGNVNSRKIEIGQGGELIGRYRSKLIDDKDRMADVLYKFDKQKEQPSNYDRMMKMKAERGLKHNFFSQLF